MTTTVTPASWGAAILTYLQTTAAKHVLFIALVAGAVIVGRSWLAEHDARQAADATVKAAQTQIDTLAKQQAAVGQAAKVEVTVLQKEAEAVKTPVEAVKALQAPPADMTSVVNPLDVQALPDAPDRVSVNALPLDQQLSACRVDNVNLGACTTQLSLQKQIDTQKETEITALKAKPSFWHRLGKVSKVIGCAAAGGFTGSYLKGGQGAAIGAATGAGVCQLF